MIRGYLTQNCPCVKRMIPILLLKISYVLSRLDEDVQCDAIAIRELCESRDSCYDLMFDRGELHIFIETLCTL